RRRQYRRSNRWRSATCPTPCACQPQRHSPRKSLQQQKQAQTGWPRVTGRQQGAAMHMAKRVSLLKDALAASLQVFAHGSFGGVGIIFAEFRDQALVAVEWRLHVPRDDDVDL